MAELNHETFDLGAVLAGIGFPEDDIEVFLDETVAYEVYKAERTLRTAEIRGNEDELKATQEALDSLKEKAKGAMYTVTVRGIPESTRKACDKKARDKFPVTYSFMGTPEPDQDRDDYYNLQLWGASIVKVTDPQGRVSLPSEDDILKLRNALGRVPTKVISDGINELVSGVQSAFEASTQDVDFLSEASLEG